MELCTAVTNIEQGLSLYIAPVHLANVFLMEEYLATDSDEYLCTNSSRFNCSIAGRFPEKLKWCSIEQVCQGLKCKAL